VDEIWKGCDAESEQPLEQTSGLGIPSRLGAPPCAHPPHCPRVAELFQLPLLSNTTLGAPFSTLICPSSPLSTLPHRAELPRRRLISFWTSLQAQGRAPSSPTSPSHLPPSFLSHRAELPRRRLISFWTSLKHKVEPQLADIAGAAEAEVREMLRAGGLLRSTRLSQREVQRLLLSEANAAFDPRARKAVNQDMSRPLCDYFINSSHNTYLTGNQARDAPTTAPVDPLHAIP
jgi:hypothetical protein